MTDLTDMTDTAPRDVFADLFTHDLHFAPGGAIDAHERRFTDGDADWRAAIFHAETNDDVHPDLWEKHPLADEVVCCLNGALCVYLRAAGPDMPDDRVRLLPGQAAVVPRDRWHRLEVDQPTDLMAITVRQGTRHEKRTPAAI